MSMEGILFKACAFEIRWGNEKGEIMSNIEQSILKAAEKELWGDVRKRRDNE